MESVEPLRVHEGRGSSIYAAADSSRKVCLDLLAQRMLLECFGKFARGRLQHSCEVEQNLIKCAPVLEDQVSSVLVMLCLRAL